MFTCELCGKRFKTNFELKKHLDKHPSEDNPLPYQCKYCEMRFPDKAAQITHSNTLHANEGDFVCELCAKRVRPYLFFAHLNILTEAFLALRAFIFLYA